MFSCSSLNFLKTANLYYLLGKLQISMSLGLVLTAEPKPNGSVADFSGVQSCFWDMAGAMFGDLFVWFRPVFSKQPSLLLVCTRVS